jgi:drug/metabolite transporter (DMT)-like permease
MMQVELRYLEGALSALFSVLVGVLFTLANGKLTQKYDSTVITVYEFFAGFVLVSAYLLFDGRFSPSFFELSARDWILILVLSSVCTAYAFTASVAVMKKLTPYTVMLTTNLEPVYGILLAYFIIGESERMSASFYIGAAVIVMTVIANGWLKARTERQQ